MKRILISVLFWLGAAGAAIAQTTFTMPPPAGVSVMGMQVVTTCGAASLANGNIAYATMDVTGTICTDTGGGGAVTIADGADVTQGAKADAACGTATGTCSEIALLKYLNTAVGSAIPAGTNTIGTTGSLPYPVGAVPYTATATGTTGATTATLAGAASVTTYICGFSIRANATAAATGNATVTGVITATMNFTQWTAPLASGLGITEMIFSPCIPASATNTSIAVVSAAPGAGGTVSVSAWGYKL